MSLKKYAPYLSSLDDTVLEVIRKKAPKMTASAAVGSKWEVDGVLIVVPEKSTVESAPNGSG